MKYLLILTLSLLSAACGDATYQERANQAVDVTDSYVFPPEMSHCTYFVVKAKDSYTYKSVIYCPNSTTVNTSNGKFGSLDTIESK